MRLLGKTNLDLRKDLLPISPATHFFMGGVVINDRGEKLKPYEVFKGELLGQIDKSEIDAFFEKLYLFFLNRY